ncbi:HlyC/CorC family transporter [Nocardioides eburneiflavus]|uniref:HlyC/CorC family transporter n=1 Tax=Nocardioides eburneiflavus TaxID=2518372 RepID=A0A4Z1CNM0_9ACTN|nr:hemolysin family protein [Nocardioides eburneiflavus]TGN66556.1 HlyC/CorC family transporter [Nocardioides eburneiflavus]
MEADTLIDVLLVLAFILVGGVFAATEIALVSLRSGQVDRLETQGGRGHAVASLARDPNRFLSAVQIGVTVAGFFSAAFGASTLAPSFAPVFEGLGAPAPETVSLVATTLVVSYLSLVLGELVPKRLALQRSVGVAKLFAPPLGQFARVMTPVIWLLSLSTDLLVRLLGGNPDATNDEVDEEELRMMISGHEDIPEGERRLVDDVFEAGDRSLSEVMKPRGDVVFLSGDLTLAEAVAIIVEQPYTRYPVTGASFDEILGYLHLRDVLGRADDRSTTVADITRELPVLPRTNRVLPSIDQLRSLGAHIALVVDEYGGTDGIVTLEDLMEELVGEIHDEYDTDAAVAASADPTTVDAGVTIEEFGERTGVELDDGPYETVAGYVLHRLARMAELGDRVMVEDRPLEVVGLDGHRITRVRLHESTVPAGDAAADSAADEVADESGPTAQQAAFADYFATWGLFLPDAAVAGHRDGHLMGHGWSVRFRWRDDGTLLVRAGHRMTNERVFAITPDGEVRPAEPEPPSELMATPSDATPEQKAEIEHAYRSAWTRYSKAVSAAGLDYDRTPLPRGLEPGADSQVWRLDDGEWHAEPLRRAPSSEPGSTPDEE